MAKTANRTLVGIMTEFTFLAQVARDQNPDVDLAALARRLARTPCSPLYNRHVSPDRELRALAANGHHPSPPGGHRVRRPSGLAKQGRREQDAV